MAYSDGQNGPITHIAGADLSGDQFCLVSLAADGQVDPTGAGAHTAGVLQDKPDAAGKDALVHTAGISKGRAGAAFAVADLLTADANGKFVEATTGDIVHATAQEAAAAEDEIVAVQLHLNGYVLP